MVLWLYGFIYSPDVQPITNRIQKSAKSEMYEISRLYGVNYYI